MYKRYTRVRLSTNVKKALDELNSLGESYSQVIGNLTKNARLLEAQVTVEHEIKSHEEAAHIAMEKAASIDGIFREITSRTLIPTVTYDHRSTYHLVKKRRAKEAVQKLDHSKTRKNLENEAYLYLIQGSPNRGVIEVIKFSPTDWNVSYMGHIPFKIRVYSLKKRSLRAKPRKTSNAAA